MMQNTSYAAHLMRMQENIYIASFPSITFGILRKNADRNKEQKCHMKNECNKPKGMSDIFLKINVVEPCKMSDILGGPSKS
jgi:hypothetical protein